MYHSSSLKVLCQVIVVIAIVLTSRFYVSGQECGQRKVKLSNRISRGNITSSDMWPWHVTITHRINNESEVVCGGSIIDKYTILTAAHCLYTKHGVITTRRVDIHVGRSELFTFDANTKVYVPEEFLIHPGHSQDSVEDDIALIRLEHEIEMSDYVQPVCVCPAENDTQIVGRIGTVIGFGLNINHEISDHLMEAQVPVVDRWLCLKSNPGAFANYLTQKMLCAGKRNAVGPCNGDSGGGFHFNNGDGWCVRGIVSFTSPLHDTNICDPQQYVVYTDVVKYIDWLRNNTNTTYYPNVQQFSIDVTQCQNGEQCETTPTESPVMSCGLPKDSGSCLNITLKYYFDTDLGFCRNFWYSGCEGNNNRFDTDLECKKTCVTPIGKDVCLLPKSEGLCKGKHRRWYYNLELKACKQFNYGGCDGNANRFKSFKDCRAVCSSDILNVK